MSNEKDSKRHPFYLEIEQRIKEAVPDGAFIATLEQIPGMTYNRWRKRSENIETTTIVEAFGYSEHLKTERGRQIITVGQLLNLMRRCFEKK